MNILYITDTGDIIGGGEISLLHLLEYIDRRRFNPSVMAPHEGTLTEKVRALGIPVIVYPYRKVSNPFNIAASRRAIGKIREIIRESGIDIIHANSTGGTAFLGGLAGKLSRTPLISHIRVLDAGFLSDIIQGMISARVIVVSRAIGGRFRYLPARQKTAVIYNGIDVDTFAGVHFNGAFRKEIGCGDAAVLAGSVGSYRRGKGFEYFIRAAKIIVSKIPRARFVIVGLDFKGGREYLRFLKDLARREGLGDKIVFLGKREDIPAVMSALDLFVFPSMCDSFGRVAAEAMAARKPVIAFETGGAAEIIEDGVTGFLVKPGDFRGMARRAVSIMENKELASAMGLRGCERAKRLFDIRRHAAQIEELYDGLKIASSLRSPQ